MGKLIHADSHTELRFVFSPLTRVDPFTAWKPATAYLSSAFTFSCVASRSARDEGQGPEEINKRRIEFRSIGCTVLC